MYCPQGYPCLRAHSLGAHVLAMGSEVRLCTLEAAASDTCPRSQDSRLMQALELVPRGVNSLPVTIEG